MNNDFTPSLTLGLGISIYTGTVSDSLVRNYAGQTPARHYCSASSVVAPNHVQVSFYCSNLIKDITRVPFRKWPKGLGYTESSLTTRNLTLYPAVTAGLA